MNYMTAGESHGPCLVASVTEVPAGLPIDPELIRADLARRRLGLGRSPRQQLESDTFQIYSGVRDGRATGAPITIDIFNQPQAIAAAFKKVEDDIVSDSAIHHLCTNAQPTLAGRPADILQVPTCSVPRPGHADFLGALAADTTDCAGISERASARETAARVAAGAIAKMMLTPLGVHIESHAEEDPETIADAQALGDTLGGTVELTVTGLLPTLGGYQDSDRLTSRIGAALFSIPTVRMVAFAPADAASPACWDDSRGSTAHDTVEVDQGRATRGSNRACGLEAGMATGQPLTITLGCKALPTIDQVREGIDLATGLAAPAPTPRHDTSVTPAVGVIAEAELAIVLADEYQRRFGYGCWTDLRANVEACRQRLRASLKFD